MKKVFIVFFVLFCLVAFAVLYPIFKYSRPHWPTIDNPSNLLQECKPLLRDDPGIIEDVDWPESIKNLYPRYVYSGQDFINVTIATGGINPFSWGFLIYPDGRTNPDVSGDSDIKGSVCPGVFKYVHNKIKTK